MKTKRCSACKETKPVSEFCKRRDSKDGLNASCKPCKSEKDRRYREANREKVAEKGRRYYEANKEKIAEYRRRWYEANRERVIERSRSWSEANREQKNREGLKLANEVNARSLELAHRQGLPWEDWEDEFVLADNGLTDYQKAVKLGRSFSSIKNRKGRLKRKANA